MNWWRRLRAWLGWRVKATMLPALARETKADRSVGYRDRATVDTSVTIEKLIASYEDEANALDQKALEYLDTYSASPANGGAAVYDASTARRNAQEKRKLVKDLKKRAGLV